MAYFERVVASRTETVQAVLLAMDPISRVRSLVDYEDFESITHELAILVPNLTLRTTKAEWIAAREQARQASFTMVTMVNADGKEFNSQIGHFISGHTKGLTVAEIEAKNKARSIKGDIGFQERETSFIEDIAVLVRPKLELTNLAKVAEHGSSDAYFTNTKGELVGLQATRLNFPGYKGQQTMNKSKAEILEMIKGRGFPFACGLYGDGTLCGAYLLRPEDAANFEKIREFPMFQPSPFKKNRDRYGSDSAAMAPYLYMWKKSTDAEVDTEIRDAFVEKIVACVEAEETRKRTIDEFAGMLSSSKLKESMYLKQIFTIFKGNVRREVNVKGDITMFVMTSRGEVKLSHTNGNQFEATLRKSGHLPTDLNAVSYFVFVVTSMDGLTEEEMTTNPDVYRFFILVPTRTVDGEPNIRFDNPFAKHFLFYFDRETLEFQKPEMLKDSAYMVIDARKPIPEGFQATLLEWEARKPADMQALITLYNETLRDKEQAARRKARAQKRAREAAARYAGADEDEDEIM